MILLIILCLSARVIISLAFMETSKFSNQQERINAMEYLYQKLTYFNISIDMDNDICNLAPASNWNCPLVLEKWWFNYK